jgi:hypothetical protein
LVPVTASPEITLVRHPIQHHGQSRQIKRLGRIGAGHVLAVAREHVE